jgi:hypothetical protein
MNNQLYLRVLGYPIRNNWVSNRFSDFPVTRSRLWPVKFSRPIITGLELHPYPMIQKVNGKFLW